MSTLRKSILLALTLYLSGCTTVPSTQSTNQTPLNSLRFEGTVEQAFEISRISLIENGVNLKSGGPKKGFVSGTRGASAWSWGEIVTINFKEESPNKIVLWVESKAKVSTNVTATDWTGRLLASLLVRINSINQANAVSGKETPSDLENTVSTGTGFFIDAKGTLVTAYHVIEGAKKIQVQLPSGEWLEAKTIKHSKSMDLAILSAATPQTEYLPIADMSIVKQGKQVFTLGYPVSGILGKEVKYTEGVISSLSGIEGEDSLMQITVPVQPGNSGGPLLSKEGEVVGVITSSAAVSSFLKLTGSLPQNINWAVKGNYITSMIGEIDNPKMDFDSDAIDRAKKAVVLIKCK
jgi:S1-C subfamily serine protease